MIISLEEEHHFPLPSFCEKFYCPGGYMCSSKITIPSAETEQVTAILEYGVAI